MRQAPGIGKAVFSGEHERFGPADHKIWYTSAISQASVGRGDALPVGLIPPPVLESMNGLLDKLGYVRVDESWGTADMPGSLLVPDDDHADDADTEQDVTPTPGAFVLADRLGAGLADRLDARMASRWQQQMAESFRVVIREPHAAAAVWWHVDLATRTLANDESAAVAGDPGDEGSGEDWSVVGTAETWLRLLDGDLNMSTALRHNRLRYCDYGENDYFTAEARITLLASLLGIPALVDGAAVAVEHVPVQAG